jgi:hypothetical protein
MHSAGMCSRGNQREEPKLLKPKMEKQIMTVRWRQTHDRYPCTRERGDGGVVDREFPRMPKRYEVETLAIDGIDKRQRFVHFRKNYFGGKQEWGS